MTAKRLLVLDLNGTILHRLTHAFEVKLFRNHPVVISKNLKPDITVHGSKIVFRPHAITFLTHVLKHFDVAVWTSSRPHNALPMVHYSFKNLLDFASILEEAERRAVSVRQVVLGPSDKGAELMKERLLDDTRGKAKLRFIWTQSECDTVLSDSVETVSAEAVDPVSTENTTAAVVNSVVSSTDAVPNAATSPPKPRSTPFIKPLRKKDLSKIYATFPAYTPQTTLIIDDTSSKLADHLDNHLRVHEFNVTQHDIDFTVDKKLLQLKKYLDKLLKEDPVDVRTFLSKHNLDDF